MRCVWEHNGEDTLLYAVDCVGAYTRGESLAVAVQKMPQEILSYAAWSGLPVKDAHSVEIVQEKSSDRHIADADSDVLFDGEAEPLTAEEYETLKALALRSAEDFLKLYRSVADADISCLPQRDTFYGSVPRTAREMYEHTKSVNAYYFGEIDVEADNEGTILDCRKRGFARLEQVPDFLQSRVIEGSYGEQWSLRKVLRRFLWHDRIHAKAMYRMAVKTFGENGAENVFCFSVTV